MATLPDTKPGCRRAVLVGANIENANRPMALVRMRMPDARGVSDTLMTTLGAKKGAATGVSLTPHLPHCAALTLGLTAGAAKNAAPDDAVRKSLDGNDIGERRHDPIALGALRVWATLDGDQGGTLLPRLCSPTLFPPAQRRTSGQKPGNRLDGGCLRITQRGCARRMLAPE